MNSMAIWALVRTLLSVGGGILVTDHLANAPDVAQASSDVMTIGPALVSLISIVAGIWSHWNMKKVPEKSIAIPLHASDTPLAAPPPVGAGVVIGGQLTRVVGCMLAALCLSLFFQGDAHAKTCLDPLNKLPIGCTPRPASVPANASPARLLDFLTQPMQDLANFISGDFAGAASLAANGIANFPDGNGNSCWTMLQSANGIFKEAPPNGPLPGPATVLEQLRLLAITANRVCQNAACTQVFTEAGNALNTVAPINGLPSLTLLCSKVPSVAQVAITTPPSVSPDASPAK